MKKTLFSLALLFSVVIMSCNKNDGGNNNTGTDSSLVVTEKAVTENFGQNIAFATYTDLKTAGDNINSTVFALADAPDATKLEAAKTAWRNMRALWEQSEGFLFGPVEDNNYDPITDTWPTDLNEMDSLLADYSNPLDSASIEKLPYSLRGYHPLEYMLWGKNSSKLASEFTDRQKTYMRSLAVDIRDQVTANYNKWAGGYMTQVTTAGQGSTEFPKFFDLFNNMNEAMIGICNEVGKSDEGSGKMWEPFSANSNHGDSDIVESPYSENSMIDFKNNVTGAYYVYIGKYKTQGKGMSDIVQLYNKSLDADIKTKFQAAISSFDLINTSFEKAIFSQRDQLQTVISSIGDVRDVLDEDLKPFLLEHITN